VRHCLLEAGRPKWMWYTEGSSCGTSLKDTCVSFRREVRCVRSSAAYIVRLLVVQDSCILFFFKPSHVTRVYEPALILANLRYLRKPSYRSNAPALVIPQCP
jgi:hypothetical protein